MEGRGGDSFEAFLQNLPLEFSPSSSVSSMNSNASFVAPHPSFTQSRSFSQEGIQRQQSPPHTSSGMLEYPRSAGKPPSFRSSMNSVADKPIQRGRHRRAHSEIAFRWSDHDSIMDNADLVVSDETGEDLFSVSMDMKGCTPRNGLPLPVTGLGLCNSEVCLTDEVMNDLGSAKSMQDTKGESQRPPQPKFPRHHHSLSMDGSLTMTEEFLMSDWDILETKKSLDMDQLAELAVTDPRRAKRILANRQSAARSKERKLKYIAELEQKVQKLQTKATSLSAQLSALQRDTSGLSAQNCELKVRLQAMEQQARLRDALNDTLKEEVQWLKSAAAQMGIGNGHHFCAGSPYHTSNQSF